MYLQARILAYSYECGCPTFVKRDKPKNYKLEKKYDIYSTMSKKFKTCKTILYNIIVGKNILRGGEIKTELVVMNTLEEREKRE